MKKVCIFFGSYYIYSFPFFINSFFVFHPYQIFVDRCRLTMLSAALRTHSGAQYDR